MEPTPDGPDIVVHDERGDGPAGRFVVRLHGDEAELVYRRVGSRLVLVHTGVPDALEGRGVGGRLVQAAIDASVAEELTVVPRCPFARSWLERHPEQAATATIDWG